MNDDDTVVPFGRRRAPAPDRRLHPSARRAVKGARDLAAEQNGPQRDAHQKAVARQQEQRLLEHGTPVPARITIALDSLPKDKAYGPAVDLACGTREGDPAGDVDAWEDVDDPRLPTGEQVRLLAAYTGWPIAFFYKPHTPVPMRTWISWGGRRGCELVEDDGVPVPPAKEPGQAPLPGMPEPDPAPRPARSRVARASRGTTAAQPTRSGRMPEHLRAELEAKLAARKRPT